MRRYIGIAVVILICAVSMEATLCFAERSLKIRAFDLLRQTFGETFFTYHLQTPPPIVAAKHFDRLLGWRNFRFDGLPPGAIESVNRDGWRSAKSFEVQKKKKRIAIVGDSYMYGWFVDDSETIGGYLQKELGAEYEVLNFAVRGYGIDQMALVATEVIPRYSPDLVIIGIIPPDFSRSCFPFQFNSRKPYFTLETNGLALHGLPVKTPREVYDEHQRAFAKLVDPLIVQTLRSRTICLASEAILRPSYNRCMNDLGPAILNWVHRRVEHRFPILVAHLDGKLPKKTRDSLAASKFAFLEIPPLLESISRELKITPQRHSDGHPKKELNRIYAHAIAGAIGRNPNFDPPTEFGAEVGRTNAVLMHDLRLLSLVAIRSQDPAERQCDKAVQGFCSIL